MSATPNTHLLLALVLLTYAFMQRERISPKGVAKLFMAGLLAILLLSFGVHAATGWLRHAKHHDHAPNAGACVMCSLAQGLIELSDNLLVVAATVLFLLCGLLAGSAGVPWSLAFLLPPGRAPPCFSHNS